MTLIKSISGIRGTIGGNIGDNLTPIDVVKFTTAFAYFLQSKRLKEWEMEQEKNGEKAHGRSSHPHVLSSAPFGLTNTLASSASFGVKRKCRIDAVCAVR